MTYRKPTIPSTGNFIRKNSTHNNFKTKLAFLIQVLQGIVEMKLSICDSQFKNCF